jgi:hypothetical protein
MNTLTFFKDFLGLLTLVGTVYAWMLIGHGVGL